LWGKGKVKRGLAEDDRPNDPVSKGRDHEPPLLNRKGIANRVGCEECEKPRQKEESQQTDPSRF
jgi:hypothetical protein